MSSNMTVTSSDGRVDVVQAPDGLQTDSSGNQNNRNGSGHPDEVQDIVSIGVAISVVEKLKEAEDEVALMSVLGIGEDKARELIGGSDFESAKDRLAKRDEIERMKDLGMDEDHAKKMAGEDLVELPGEKIPKEDYVFDAVREVVIDMLSANLGNEDEVVVFRTFETRLADKIREKESDPTNRERENGEKVESDSGSE